MIPENGRWPEFLGNVARNGWSQPAFKPSGQLDPSELASVIERAQRCEAEAFDTLVDAYSRRLYGFLYRLTGSREDAEDLVQEVFLRVVRTIGRYRHEGRFEPWIFRIAANLTRDRARRRARTPEITSLGAVGEPEDRPGNRWGDTGPRANQPPEGGLELEENVDRLQLALAGLPQAEREVLMFRHYGHMSFAQIAEVMGTPLGTALARAHRGLGKLREWMESGP